MFALSVLLVVGSSWVRVKQLELCAERSLRMHLACLELVCKTPTLGLREGVSVSLYARGGQCKMQLLGDAVLGRCASRKCECEPRRDHRVQVAERQGPL